MIKLTLFSLLIAAGLLWVGGYVKCHQSSSLPSLYATRTADGDTATCYADGKSWPARVDGSTLNCFTADMPKENKR